MKDTTSFLSRVSSLHVSALIQMSQSSSPAISSGYQQPSPLEEGASARLRKQIEFYFSPGNLARDRYLVSILQQSGGVMLGTIANFPKVRTITSQLSSAELGRSGDVFSFIASCLQESQVVVVSPDRNWIIPRSMMPPAIMPMVPPQHRHSVHPMHQANGQLLHQPNVQVMPFPQQQHHPVNSPRNEDTASAPSQSPVQQQPVHNPILNSTQSNPMPNNAPPVPILMPHAMPMYVPMPPSGPGYFPYSMPPLGMYTPQPSIHNNSNYYNNGNNNRHQNYNNNRGNGGGVGYGNNTGRFNRRNGGRNPDGSYLATNRRHQNHSSNGQHQSRPMNYSLNSASSNNRQPNTIDQNDSNKKQHQQQNSAPRQGNGKDHYSRKRNNHNANNNADSTMNSQNHSSYTPTTIDFPSLAIGGEVNNKKSASNAGNYAAALLNKSPSCGSIKQSASSENLPHSMGALSLDNDKNHTEKVLSYKSKPDVSSQLPSANVSTPEENLEDGPVVNSIIVSSQSDTHISSRVEGEVPASSKLDIAAHSTPIPSATEELESAPDSDKEVIPTNAVNSDVVSTTSGSTSMDKGRAIMPTNSQYAVNSFGTEKYQEATESQSVWGSKRLFADVRIIF